MVLSEWYVEATTSRVGGPLTVMVEMVVVLSESYVEATTSQWG